MTRSEEIEQIRERVRLLRAELESMVVIIKQLQGVEQKKAA